MWYLSSCVQESEEGQTQLDWEKQKMREADERRKAAAKAGEGVWSGTHLLRAVRLSPS
jgi:hypothetical protein